MSKINKAKRKVTKFWRDNKGYILTGGAVIGAVASAIIVAKSDKDKPKKPYSELGESTVIAFEGDYGYKTEPEYGRDCLMTFSVEDTGEVLWKERCTESYVNDSKAIGIKYEEVRKLNGLE